MTGRQVFGYIFQTPFIVVVGGVERHWGSSLCNLLPCLREGMVYCCEYILVVDSPVIYHRNAGRVV